MRRVTGAVVLVLGLAAGVSSAAPQADWKRLRYVYSDPSTTEVYLSTGAGWGGKAVTPMREYPLGLVPRWALDRRLAPRSLWTATCTRGAQTALFSREFQVPGPAKEGTLVVALAGLGSQAITSASVTVNGREIGRTDSYSQSRGYSELQLDARDLAAFRHGTNVLAVRARKPALGPFVKACNTPNDRRTDRRRVGVAVGLRATFLADVRTFPSFAGRKAYFRAAPNRSVVLEGQIRIRNEGPAASVAGRFRIEAVASTSLKILTGAGEASVRAPTPFGACATETRNPFKFYVVTCPFADFPPGKEVVVRVPVIVRLDPELAVNFSQTSVKIDWQISGTDDDRTVNGMASHEVVFCGVAATDPACKTAK